MELQTELNGLKWRCFLTPSNSPRGIPVQSDPILKAYGNCLRVRIDFELFSCSCIFTSFPPPFHFLFVFTLQIGELSISGWVDLYMAKKAIRAEA